MSRRTKEKSDAKIGSDEVKSIFNNLIIIVILGSATIFPFIFDSFTVSKLSVLSLGLLVFSFRLLKMSPKAQLNRIPPLLITLLIAFSLVLIVAWAQSDMPFMRGAFGQFGRGNGLFYYFFTILIFVFSLKTSTIVKGNKAHQLIIYFSYFLVVYTTLQKIGIDVAKLDTKGISSVVLTYGNSNFAGGMLSVLFTYHLIYGINSKKFNVHTTLLLVGLLVTTTFAAAVQGYLIVIFALAFGISLYFYQHYKSRLVSISILIGWSLGLLLIILGIQGKLVLSNIFARTSFQARIEYWRIALEIIRDYPIFGVGPDKLYDVTANYMSPGSLQLITLTRMDNAHNWYLNLGASFGVIALVLFLLILGWVFVAGFKLIIRADLLNSFSIASFSAFVAMFIDGLVSIEQPGIGIWLYFFAGTTIGSLLSAATQTNTVFPNQKDLRVSKAVSSGRNLRPALVLILIAGLAFSSIATVNRVFQDALLRKSIQTQLLGQGNESTLEAIESIAVNLKAEPEYAGQALPTLAALGDGQRMDTVSQAAYEYYRSSIQATLIRAEVLRAIGRVDESCPLRITLISNTPWDMSQLEAYLICLVSGLDDSDYLKILKRVSQHLPTDESSEIPRDGLELNKLLSRFQTYAVVARANFLSGSIKKATQERDYAFTLYSRILELEKLSGSSGDPLLRKSLLSLLDF